MALNRKESEATALRDVRVGVIVRYRWRMSCNSFANTAPEMNSESEREQECNSCSNNRLKTLQQERKSAAA